MILLSLRSTAFLAAGRSLSCSTTMRGMCFSPGATSPFGALHIMTGRKRGEQRRGPSLSMLSSSSPMTNKKNDENDGYNASSSLQRQQVRSYHATRQREIIAPFIPEMILFVIVAGGWTAYRTYKGRPLTPDEALEAQEAYRKHEEKLQQQWHEHHKKHRSGKVGH